MELKKVSFVVEDCLKENKDARDSDWVLYETVCKKLGFDTEKTTLHQLVNARKLFPTFESVTRARRKLQSEGLYLPSENVDRKRFELQKEYIKNYARG